MSILEISNLSHGYAEKNLYKDAAFEINKGEHIGIVGINGSGKSTLLKIILGEVIPDEGYIKWQSNVKIGFLDQYADVIDNIEIIEYLNSSFIELYKIESEMNKLYELGSIEVDEKLLIKASKYQEYLEEKNFYNIDVKINKIVIGLGLNALGIHKKMNELSGGQKAKVILAKLLLTKPDVMILDEPTNFLDKEHVEWLSDYMSNYKSAFVVVSHDYDFLEKVVDIIYDIEFQTIKKYHGNYSQFLKQKKFLRDDYINKYNSQQKHIKETEEFISKYKAGIKCKMARGRQKQLDRLERMAAPEYISKPKIIFPNIMLVANKVLELKNLEVGYNYPLLPKLNFSVSGGQKLVLTGFNGIGKSTILKTIIGEIKPISGSYKYIDSIKIGYYEQNLKWQNENLSPLQIILNQYPQMTIKQVRKHLSDTGLKEEHILRSVSSLSGGEQSKVKLCALLLKNFNFLIMDEPTNHLDKETKESLQTAINNFKGSIIIVSHEEKFYKQFADKIINIEDLFS